MRRLLVGLLVLGAEHVVAQEAPSLKHAGLPFSPGNIEVIWAAPTNQQPKTLWVYKTVPQHFSDAAISNLMALGSFTMRDKEKVTAEERAQLPAEDRAAVENVLGFETEDEARSLGILPAYGWIHYQDIHAYDVRTPIEDVPSEAMAEELGLKLLDQIGIPRSELAKRRNSSKPLTFMEGGTQGHYDKTHGRQVDGIYCRGVFFIRQIDGVNFAGIGVAGGFYVNFVSHAKIRELDLVWRNLQPYKKYQVTSADQITQWIKEGKAVLPGRNDGLDAVRRLTVTQLSPLYMGELGDKRQDFTYPFASLDAIADTGKTNIAIDLYCPILTDKEVSP